MTMSAAYHLRFTTILLAAVVLAGCGGDTKARSTTPPPGATAPPQSVAPTGRVITVEMITDEKGNYYRPAKLEVHQGDVLRFTLVSGVHNVHFLADSNAGKTGLPPVSDYLQIPGQTWDLQITLAPGHYYFQCDPHAALGMVAWLEVEDE